MSENDVVKTVSEEVLHCPFCDSVPEVWAGAAREWVHVQCRNIVCLQPHVDGFWKHVLKKWNRRGKI